MWVPIVRMGVCISHVFIHLGACLTGKQKKRLTINTMNADGHVGTGDITLNLKFKSMTPEQLAQGAHVMSDDSMVQSLIGELHVTVNTAAGMPRKGDLCVGGVQWCILGAQRSPHVAPHRCLQVCGSTAEPGEDVSAHACVRGRTRQMQVAAAARAATRG